MSTNVGNLEAYLGLNTLGLNKGLASAQARMRAAGAKMKSIGRTMTMGISLPLIAIGGSAIKMAIDFEKSMSKIEGLVGIASEKVKAFRGDVMNLAGETGKAPLELADALFFVTSAGFRGAEALSILEMAAKGSTAGLGETKVVADLITSAVNAYGIENLSAAKATDILTAAVREGKAEAPELAASLGQVLPIASALGVSFDQIGASVASMTRTGTNAATAAIQLRQILASLLKPSQQAEEAMAKMGTSSAEMRKQLREKGLISVLGFFSEQLKTNEQAMAQVFPNIRALSGALDIMGSNSKENIDIFQRMTNVTGMTDEAFSAASKTVSFQFNQSLAELKVEAIALGTTLMPIFTGIVKAVRNGVRWFKNLSEESKKMGIALTGIAIAAGPVIWALGAIAAALAGITWPIAAAIAALAVLVAAFVYFSENWDAVIERVSDWSWWKNMLIDMTSFLIKNNVFSWMFEYFKFLIRSIIKGWDVMTNTLGDITWWKELLASMISFFTKYNPFTLIQEAIMFITGTAMPTISDVWEGILEETKETTKDLDLEEVLKDPFGALSEGLESLRDDTVEYKHEFGSFTDAMINGANKAKKALAGLIPSGGSGGGTSPTGAQVSSSGGQVEQTTATSVDVTSIKEGTAALQEMDTAAMDLSGTLKQSLSNALISLGETLGAVFSGDADAKSFFSGILLIVADFLASFGKSLIAAGVAAIAFKALISNPYAALAAGIALIAAAAVVRSVVSKGLSKKEGEVQGLRSGGFVTEGGVFQLHKDEMVSLPRGSAVTSQRNSRAAGGNVNVSVNGFIGNPTELAREVKKLINNYGNTASRTSFV